MGEIASSLVNSVYKRLRGDILAGRLVPDQKLKIQEVSSTLGVSASVVREALTRLAAESLVAAEPQRGFRVMPLYADDVADLTDVRIDIEVKCLRRAISNATMEWEKGIVASLHELIRTPYDLEDPSEDWTEAHANFHRALVFTCDSPWLLRIREQLFAQSERYRRINIRMSANVRDLRTEHEEIAKAVLSRDLAHSVQLVTDHLRSTATLTIQSFNQACVTPKEEA